jgi:uncharacterized glyoxalase superfamily protein PhnB
MRQPYLRCLRKERGSLSLFMEGEGIDELLAAIQKSGANITVPLKQQFYGMRGFAFQEPEGWVVTSAETVN